jgi:hypothetical protein
MSTLDDTFSQDSNTLRRLYVTSPEVFRATTNALLAATQVVYALEKIETVRGLSVLEKSKLQPLIAQHARDGLLFLALDGGFLPSEKNVFLSMIQGHLQLISLLANPQSSRNLEQLSKQLTPQTPDIVHYLMNQYRRLLYMPQT